MKRPLTHDPLWMVCFLFGSLAILFSSCSSKTSTQPNNNPTPEVKTQERKQASPRKTSTPTKDSKKNTMTEPLQATYTDVQLSQRSLSADWTLDIALTNTTQSAAWFIVPGSLDTETLEGKAAKASGFKFYHASGLSPVPFVELVGTPGLYALYIPAGAGVKMEGLVLRQPDTTLPKALRIWTAEDIYVDGASIHDSWLLGLDVHTPPRTTRANVAKRTLQKQKLNKNFVSDQLAFEELKANSIPVDLGSLKLPETIEK